MSPLRYLLDTNICIYIAKQRPPSVAKRFARLASGSVGMIADQQQHSRI